jgi:ATP-binding protein involved in chromosome partitioning
LAHACDLGRPFVDTARQNLTAEAIGSAFEPLLNIEKQGQTDTSVSGVSQKENHVNKKEKKGAMRIAIPVTEGKLSAHFGHCEEFAVVDVDEQTREIAGVAKLLPPAHEPGVLPKWLSEQKADVIIAGGMGQRAQ